MQYSRVAIAWNDSSVMVIIRLTSIHLWSSRHLCCTCTRAQCSAVLWWGQAVYTAALCQKFSELERSGDLVSFDGRCLVLYRTSYVATVPANMAVGCGLEAGCTSYYIISKCTYLSPRAVLIRLEAQYSRVQYSTVPTHPNLDQIDLWLDSWIQ